MSTADNDYILYLLEELQTQEGGEEFKKTLLSRLGGEGALETALEKLYDSVITDKELIPFFDKVDMHVLKAHQHRFMTVAFTQIPKDFDAKAFIIERHYRLFEKGITEEHFDLVVKHLETALQSCLVDVAVIEETKQHLGPFREVFETTKREDIMAYLRKSVGCTHQSKILEAKNRRRREQEENERKARKKGQKAGAKLSSCNRSLGTIGEGEE
jgi:hemoglobin